MQNEELAGIISRAHQLQEITEDQILESREARQIYDAMVESGIDSTAALMALRERLAVEARPQFKSGDFVLASVEDKWLIPARFVETDGDVARVRFLSRSDGEVPLKDLRRMQIYPGLKVHCEYWGSWVEAEVSSFNPEALSLQVNYYGTKWNVGLDGIKLKDKSKQAPWEAQWDQIKYYVLTALASGAGGALLMFIIQRIASR